MKLIYTLLFALLATWVYANPLVEVEDFNEEDRIMEGDPIQRDEDECDEDDDDDDDDEDDDDDDDDDDDEDDDDDDNKKCLRTSLKKCLKSCSSNVRKCLKKVIRKYDPDDEEKMCIKKLPDYVSEVCDQRKKGKPRKCMKYFKKCVQGEGSGLEL